MDFNKVISIDFEYIGLFLKRRIIWIILAAVIAFPAGAAVAYYGLEVTDNFRATATVYSFTEGGSDQTMLGITALQTYSETIKSKKIARKAHELLGYSALTENDIYNMLSTEPRYFTNGASYYENDLVVIPVYADSENITDSIAVANAAADAFVEEINHLLGTETVRVLDYANTAEQTEYGTVLILLISAGSSVAAVLLVLMLLILIPILSLRVRTMKDLSLYGQITVLGVLPDNKKRGL